jgi:hypothetical protein
MVAPRSRLGEIVRREGGLRQARDGAKEQRGIAPVTKLGADVDSGRPQDGDVILRRYERALQRGAARHYVARETWACVAVQMERLTRDRPKGATTGLRRHLWPQLGRQRQSINVLWRPKPTNWVGSAALHVVGERSMD